MKKPRNEPDLEMLDVYDFSGGVRGKYVDRFPKGSNVVVLEPPSASVEQNSECLKPAKQSKKEVTEPGAVATGS